MTAPALPEPPQGALGRFSVHLPRPPWIFLATVVLVVVAIGLRIGLPSYRREVAIREIERLGGMVETRKCGPKWLRDWLGDKCIKFFDEVTFVVLDAPDVTDADLVHVMEMSKVEVLVLSNAQITDAGLVQLKGLTKLEFLNVIGTEVTDAGIAELKSQLPGVEVVRDE